MVEVRATRASLPAASLSTPTRPARTGWTAFVARKSRRATPPVGPLSHASTRVQRPERTPASAVAVLRRTLPSPKSATAANRLRRPVDSRAPGLADSHSATTTDVTTRASMRSDLPGTGRRRKLARSRELALLHGQGLRRLSGVPLLRRRSMHRGAKGRNVCGGHVGSGGHPKSGREPCL